MKARSNIDKMDRKERRKSINYPAYLQNTVMARPLKRIPTIATSSRVKPTSWKSSSVTPTVGSKLVSGAGVVDWVGPGGSGSVSIAMVTCMTSIATDCSRSAQVGSAISVVKINFSCIA